ncbi:MAG: hypothetical protein ABSD49_11395 [Candidatus Bathyarchaeia archaeon]|jgi:hypothetical protein
MQATTRALHCITGVSLGIGLLVVLNQLQIPFYLYYPRTTNTVLISPQIDLYLFLATSVCVPCTFAIFSRSVSKSGLAGILAIWVTALSLAFVGEPYGLPTLYVTVIFAAILNTLKAGLDESTDLLVYALVIGVLIEFAAVFYWVGAGLNPLGKLGMPSEFLDADLTFSLYTISLLIMLILMFSWLWIPLVHRFVQPPPEADNQLNFRRWNLRLIAASLDLLAIVTVLLFFYPYLAGQTWVVGVDSLYRYLEPLTALTGIAPSQAMAISYSHGLYLVLLYIIQLASGASSFSIVKFAPLVLAFATASTIFATMSNAGWRPELALLSSLCALLWLPTTLGFYAGIQANWFAYLLWMLFLSFYFLNQKWNAIIFLVQGVISLAILLIHPWTWGIFLTSLALTALISNRTPWQKKGIQGLLAALVLALPIGGVAYQLLPGMKGDLVNTFGLYAVSIQQVNLSTFVGAFEEMFYNWGSFLSPTLLLICLIGAYALAGRHGIARNYLIAWIATWCIGSILVAPYNYHPTNITTSETELWRLLYLSPLPFLLALGIEKCANFLKRAETMQAHASPLVLIAPCILAGFGLGLFIAMEPVVRFVILLASFIAMIVLMVRFPDRNPQIARLLISVLLVLLMVNAAYRSLYPLLLDPHNLHTTISR